GRGRAGVRWLRAPLAPPRARGGGGRKFGGPGQRWGGGGAPRAPPQPPISRVSRVWFLLRPVEHVASQGRPTLRGLRGSATTNASTFALLAGSVKWSVFPAEVRRCDRVRSSRWRNL